MRVCPHRQLSRPQVFRTTKLEDANWRHYVGVIAEDHCPFLARGMAIGSVTFSFYEIDERSDWEEFCFALGVVHAELVRSERITRCSSPLAKLTCENLLFSPKRRLGSEQELFFQWLHWGLKVIYTEAGLVFGKFWPDEIFVGRAGGIVQNPPEMMLSIRSTVGQKDAQFFDISPTLADKHSHSHELASIFYEQLNSHELKDLRLEIESSGSASMTFERAVEHANRIASSRLLRHVISADAFDSFI